MKYNFKSIILSTITIVIFSKHYALANNFINNLNNNIKTQSHDSIISNKSGINASRGYNALFNKESVNYSAISTFKNKGLTTNKQNNYTEIVKNVDAIAEKITVRISTPDNPYHGSGVIIAKEENTYYVVTAGHNFQKRDEREYQIVTLDGESYRLNNLNIEKSDDYDVAIISFESDRSYDVASLAKVDPNRQQVLFVSGFPKLESNQPQRIITGGRARDKYQRDFDSKDSDTLQQQSLLYTNISYEGMSGGAILDTEGRLVGINASIEVGGSLYVEEEDDYENFNLGFSSGVEVQDILGWMEANRTKLTPQSITLSNSIAKEVSASDWQDIESQLLTVTVPSDYTNLVAWMNYGNLLWRYERYTEALKAFQRVIEIDPKFDKAYYAKGLVYWFQGEFQQAATAFEQAININENLYYYWRWLSSSYSQLNQYDLALTAIDRAIQQMNKNPTIAKDFLLYIGQGDILKELDRNEESIKSYTEAIKLKPKHTWGYNNRGVVYGENLEQYQQAITDFNKAINFHSEDSYAFGNRGFAYSKLGKYQEAITDFNKAINIDSQLVEVYNNKGNIYNKMGQHEEAIVDFNKAINIDPQYANAYISRGITYDYLKKYQQAIADFNKAIDINPQHPKAYYNRALTYGDLKEYQKAIDDYTKAITYNPEYKSAYYNRGVIYNQQEEYQKALDDYTKAITYDPQHAYAYTNRGTIYQKQEEYQKAIDDYTKAININPDYVTPYYNRGLIYYSLGEIRQTMQDWELAARLFQQQSNIEAYQYLQEQLNQLDLIKTQ